MSQQHGVAGATSVRQRNKSAEWQKWYIVYVPFARVRGSQSRGQGFDPPILHQGCPKFVGISTDFGHCYRKGNVRGIAGDLRYDCDTI